MAQRQRINPSPDQVKDEVNFRLKIFNQLLKTPHRDLTESYRIHAEAFKDDPMFYPHLAAWYDEKGEIRDHKELFIINLILSEYQDLRNAGLAMLRTKPPYQVQRIVDFVKGWTKKVAIKEGDEKRVIKLFKDGDRVKVPNKAKGERPNTAMTYAEFMQSVSKADSFEIREWTKEEKLRQPDSKKDKKLILKGGLFRNPPKSLKTEVRRYLHEREADPVWFDSAVLQARKSLKRLYQTLRLPRGTRANSILIENNPPSDSVFAHLKEFSSLTTPAEKSRFIAERKIPARVAFTLIPKAEMRPSILLSIINNMSPQEAYNSAELIKSYGGFDVGEIESLYKEKVSKFTPEKKLSVGKTTTKKATKKLEKSTSEGDKRVAQAIEKAADKAVKKQIKGRICLAVDKSSSQQTSIEVGRKIASIVGASCIHPPVLLAFDRNTFRLDTPNTKLSDLEKVFDRVKANGMTSCGSALAYLVNNKIEVDTFVMVTDGGENQSPEFSYAVGMYQREMGFLPKIVFIWVDGDFERITPGLKRMGIEYDEYTFKGDYYALDNLIPMLSSTHEELIQEIMSTPLPVRKRN